MVVALRCIACGSSEGCSCQNSLVRFFQLLESASERERVSTPILTSLGPINAKVCIDKLSGQLLSPIGQQAFTEHLKNLKIQHRVTRLKDKKWYLQAGDPETGRSILFLLGHPNNPVISKVVTRPSAFSTYDELSDLLANLLPATALESFRISRLDLAIDYPLELGKVLQGLEIDFKQAKVSYLDNGAKRTGVLIGKGSEKVLIYDKSIESNLAEPLTRIELQLSGSKLPTKCLTDLPRTIQSWTPFKGIKLNNVDFKDSVLLSEREQKRINELKHLLFREGFFSAKKLLNKDRNFDRDYKKLISITPWDQQPASVFQIQISLFINQKQKGNNNDKFRKANRCESH